LPSHAVTTSVAETVCVRLPLTPLMESAYVPGGVLDAVATERLELAPVVGLGLKEPVAPDGRPDTLSATEPVKPPLRAILTVYEVLADAATVLDVGVTVSEKSPAAGAVTTKVAEVLCVNAPLTPVIVRVKLPVAVVELVVKTAKTSCRLRDLE